MEMARERNYYYREMLPFVAMVVSECTTVGSSTIYKAAVSKGLSYHIFMLYTYTISALVVLPLSYIFHRKTHLPPLTTSYLINFLFLGLLGYTGQYLGNVGLALSNPALGSVMSNILPATTFILAVLFRMEKIELQTTSSQAKIIGTVLSMAGAFVVALFRGPAIIRSQAHNPTPVSISLVSVESDWIAACAALAAQYIIASIWYIFQAKVLQEYPAEILLVFFYNATCAVLSLVNCLVAERDFNAWKVEPDVRLVAILYAVSTCLRALNKLTTMSGLGLNQGTLGTGLSILIHAWAIHCKGPVYVALFTPMTIAIAAFMSVILLGESLYLGCIIGSIVITAGFYTVVWGKSKENSIGDKPMEVDRS